MLYLDIPSDCKAVAAGFASVIVVSISGVGLKLVRLFQNGSASNVQSRWKSGILLSVLALLCVYLGGIPFSVFVGVVSWISAGELLKLLGASEPRIFTILTHLANVSIIACAWAESQFINNHSELHLQVNAIDVTLLFWLLSFLLVPIFAGRFRHMPVQEAKMMLVVICTGWFLSHAILLRNMPDGFGAVMFLLLGVTCNDIFAYLTGNLFGRTKLAETLSPKKTVEGMVGGTIGTLLVAIPSCWILNQLSLPAAMALAVLIASLAPCGDLVVSVIKRDAGVKDSSSLIPGHGGMLDRFGSFLLVTPVFYYACALALGRLHLHF